MMSLFKKMVTRDGKIRFFKDNKYVKQDEVNQLPVAVHALDPGNSIEIGEPPITPPVELSDKKDKQIPKPKKKKYNPKYSVVSGKPATRIRWLNGTQYGLTDDEYQTYSLGKIAQAVREKGL